MTLDEVIERYTRNAEYERTHGNLQGCLEFRQLVEWLSALQEYKDVLDKLRAEIEDERIDIDLDLGEEVYYNKAIDDVLQIIGKYMEGANE